MTCPHSPSNPKRDRRDCGGGARQAMGRRVRRWMLPVTGALALLWFLARVIPKPSRATYPCVQASFPAASAFVIWLAGVLGALSLLKRIRRTLATQKPLVACGLTLLVFLGLGVLWLGPFGVLPHAEAFTPEDGPNDPMGVGKGVCPGRVVWVRDPAATPWDGKTGNWWDPGSTDQAVVDKMISLSLRRLVNAGTDPSAWDTVFRYFNATHGRGERGYASGEKISIKINCNNAYGGHGDADGEIDASPQVVHALLDQLVNVADVPQDRITVYEAVRFIPDRIVGYCAADFPSVVWADSSGGDGRVKVQWVPNAMAYSTNNSNCGTSVPTCVVEADYLINAALLKGHFIAGVTMTAKNHFGSIDAQDHTAYVNCAEHPMGSYSPLVDLMGAPVLGGKTLIYFIDGLYGGPDYKYIVADRARWRTFGNQWSSSLFASLDPVALDSVGLDFLRTEYGETLGYGHAANADNYLHEAAQAGAPPSGMVYRPNGARLASLGVHEHWNNPTDRLYSRNLGHDEGIELVQIAALPESSKEPPVLEWRVDDGQIEFTWPDTPVEYVLQAQPFYGGDDWTTLPYTPVHSNGLLKVSVRPTEAVGVFRLMKKN